MDAEVLNKFLESAQAVLQTEIGEPVRPGRLSVQTIPYTSQEVTTLIGVTGSVQGVMLLGMPERTAKLLVSRMIGQEVKDFDQLAQSGIAEMGNVIAGTAVTGLSAQGHSCKISPPTLIIGSGTTISTLNIQRLVVPLETSCGPVEVQLALKANGVPRTNCAATPGALAPL